MFLLLLFTSACVNLNVNVGKTEQTTQTKYADVCSREISQMVQSWREKFPERQTDLLEFESFNNKVNDSDYAKKWASKVVYIYDSYKNGEKIKKPSQTKLYNTYGHALDDIKNLNDNFKEVFIGVVKMEEDKGNVFYNTTIPYVCFEGSILSQSKKWSPNILDSLT